MAANFKTNKSFSDTKPRVGRPDIPKPQDFIDFIKMPDNEFVQMRLVGPTFSYAVHWIEVFSEKSGAKVRFAKNCLGYSHETEDFDDTKCPYCKAGLKTSIDYISNAIIRDLQDEYTHSTKKWEETEKETGFKDKASKSKTPVRVVRFTATTAEKLKKRSLSNKAKDKKGNVKNYPLSDSKYGKDINYLYNSKGTGSGKYEIEVQELTPLNDEEKDYLLWDIENCVRIENMKDAEAEVKSLKKRNPELFGENENSDEDNEMAKVKNQVSDSDSDLDTKKKKAPAKTAKGKAKKAASSSDLDSDSDSDSDSDEKPAAKKAPAKAAKGKAKKAASSSDLDSDSDSDSDEKPAKKAPAKAAKGKAKKAASSSDLDSDSDSDSDSDEKPAAKKAPAKGKAKKAASSDDSDSDSDSDSDEKPKKKAPAKKAPAKGKAKKAASSSDLDSDSDSDSDSDE